MTSLITNRASTRLSVRSGGLIQSSTRPPITSFNLALVDRSTTGTITAGTYDLTLPNGHGFSAGDPIIVGINTSSSTYGTKGVGGVWPLTSYATEAAMNADTSRALNTYVWAEDTGNVWVWSPSWGMGAWHRATEPVYWYSAKARPEALVAKILSFAGNVATLDKPAVASTTNAPVYYDNYDYLLNIMVSGGDNMTYNFPAGNFAVSKVIRFGSALFAPTNRHYVGAGQANTRLFSPGGCPNLGFWIQYATGCTVRNMTLDSGMDWYNIVGEQVSQPPGYYNTAIPALTVTWGWAYGVNCEFLDVTTKNHSQSALQAFFCTNVFARRCHVQVDQVFRNYTQWAYEWNDCTGGGTVDCTSQCLTGLIPVMESFRCSGTSHTGFNLDNGLCSLNSAGGHFVMQGAVRVRTGAIPVESYVTTQPLCAVAVNVSPPSSDILLGGTITLNMTIDGYLNAANDLPAGIVVNVDNENVTVLNGFYNAGSLGYVAGSTRHGAQGVVATALGTIIDGFVNTGGARAPVGYDANILNTKGTTRNTTAEYIDTHINGGGNTYTGLHIYP